MQKTKKIISISKLLGNYNLECKVVGDNTIISISKLLGNYNLCRATSAV